MSSVYCCVGRFSVGFSDRFGVITWQESHDLYEDAKQDFAETSDPTGEHSRCVAKCLAKRELICAPSRLVWAGIGFGLGAVASEFTVGLAFPVTTKVGSFMGSWVGRIVCEMDGFDQSCNKECKECQ